MEFENQLQPEAQETAAVLQETAPAIGANEIRKFMKVLQQYKTGKTATDRRIIASEQWWKLRNTEEEQKETEVGKDGGFTSRSAWLHNVIVSKHADAMKAYPVPLFLAREEADEAEAEMLTTIVFCILENNKFEKTYSDVQWQKMKTGTGAYKVVWDKNMLNGLGDIRVDRVNLLNLYWEPGITDIQKSRYFFQTEMVEKEVLLQKYPQLEGKLSSKGIFSSRFLYDDAVPTSDYATVVEVYYHKHQQGKKTLHYCKFVGDQVLFATENETEVRQGFDGKPMPAMALVGLYDHGLFPYVFDPLFPIEGSPCGYGFVDLEKNPQTEIDIMKTAFVKNAMAGAIPRFFAQENATVKAEDFLDLSKPLVPVSGNIDETSYRRIEHNSLDGNYLNLLQQDIQELRETSGNTETATGTTNSGVTAASAIAALQEASGKGSLDSNMGSYRAHGEVSNLVVELMRQFYDMPRKFRIVGKYGMHKYITYSNAGLQMQPQMLLGQNMGMRKPVFDIKINAQKKNAFTTVSQNELALQFFKMQFFNPQMADQALMCLEMMEFDGKDTIMQKIAENGQLWQKLQMYMQMALQMAQQLDPMMAQTIAMDITRTLGGTPMAAPAGGDAPKLVQSNNVTGLQNKEHALVENARERAASTGMPGGSAANKEG
jgi:hypothetical protein